MDDGPLLKTRGRAGKRKSGDLELDDEAKKAAEQEKERKAQQKAEDKEAEQFVAVWSTRSEATLLDTEGSHC